MRQHHYNFAHRVLPHDVTSRPDLWGIITSDRAASYLQVRWKDAAPGSTEPSTGLIWIGPVWVAGVEIRLIRMPPPQSMAETHYAAIARSPSGEIRYFVAEQGDGRVYMAEWAESMRVRYGELLEWADASPLGQLSPSAAPWEVAPSSIPGLPYAVAFLHAVAAEMANTARNTHIKQIGPPVKSNEHSGVLSWILVGVAIIVVAMITSIRF